MNDRFVPPPCAELLAAYFEGTLEPAERGLVEAWLVEHPDTAAELAAGQRLERLFHLTAAPEPSAAAWDAARARVEQGLASVRVVRGTQAVRWRNGIAITGAAAALLLAMWYFQRPDVGFVRGGDEPFPVAVAEDVEIISIDAAGARALVVGELPLQAPVVLLAAGDATLKSVEVEPNGQFPDVRMGIGPNESPMIVGPVVAGVLQPQ
jgi:hypothetical protein